MTQRLKSTALVIAGTIWIALAMVIALFLLAYLTGGAGFQYFGSILGLSFLSISFGFIHYLGLMAAIGLSFIIGVGLCIYGLVPASEPENPTPPRP